MKYVRFMGYSELTSYMQGKTLTNDTKWRQAGQCSDSEGFCFFDDSVRPEERMAYLTGIVTMDVVAIFERTSEEPMKKTQGRYRDPEKDRGIFSPISMKFVDEYSVKNYSMNDMKLVDAGVVVGAFARKIRWGLYK